MYHRMVPGLALAAAAAVAVGCNSTPSVPAAELRLEVRSHRVESAGIPAVGTDSTLDVGTWNLEWFGDAGNGPDDEPLQLANVAAVMGGLAVDLWSVQEVTRRARFDDLLARLDGYAGFLADDPLVAAGADYYSDFGGNELKVGLVYREDQVTVDSARVILTGHDYEFAGRPPVEVHLSTAAAGRPLEMVVILVHAKAGADTDDRDRRAAGADALKSYLDARYPDRPVLVIGDFNDDVDTSIATGQPSPYRDFVQDDADYRFITAPLSTAGATSTVFYSDMIDHQLATDELAALHVDGSAVAFRADAHIDGYGETTSDHYPVLARYGPGGPTVVAAVTERGVAELGWVGARSDSVDVYRQGSYLVTTGNDGSHTDEVALTEGAPVTYRICEAGTDLCSNEATATF